MPNETFPAPPVRQQDCVARARDRVLLYTRGLDVDPLLALELAMESLRRAGLDEPDAAPSAPAGDHGRDAAPPPPEHSPPEYSPPDQPLPDRPLPDVSLPDMPRVMAELRALLLERGIRSGIPGRDGLPLRSSPSLNRRRMIAEEMDRSLLRRVIRRLGTLVAFPGRVRAS